MKKKNLSDKKKIEKILDWLDENAERILKELESEKDG